MKQCVVHKYLQLFTTPDNFYMKPAQLCCNSKDVLVIDRATGKAAVKELDLVKILGPDKDFKLIFGFLGSIKLLPGLYLVVVTYADLLGKVNGASEDNSIFRVAGTELIPYARSTKHLTKQQVELNKKYERMVCSILELPGVYFSCGYDLTHSVQKLHSVTPDFYKKSLVSRADPHFLWNRHLLKDFFEEQFGSFTLPAIQGFVSINHMTVDNEKVTFSLISRRSVDRTGTRLFVRGIDSKGNVANHVVTEQIVHIGNNLTSYLITRGSVPLPWVQYPDLKVTPTPCIVQGDHSRTFEKHFRDLVDRYGNVVAVDLLSQKGYEAALASGYSAAAASSSVSGLSYLSFDFKAECGHTSFDRLDVLVKRVEKHVKQFSYFHSQGGIALQQQTGVFRVNCLDCLDRTNVVQSVLAKMQLKDIFERLGVNDRYQCEDDEISEWEEMVNNVWADNADMISTQYAGTAALKNDFTRTGTRTYLGVILDLINGVSRYDMSNFSDGYKQDAFDVYLGNYVIPEGEGKTMPSPLNRRHKWNYIVIPTLLVIAVSMFCAVIILSRNFTTGTLLHLFFWAGVAAVSFNYICRNGKEFVDWPKLCVGERAATSKRKTL